MKLPQTCYFCGRKISKSLQRVNESIKFGWKTYCSSQCRNQAKSKQVTVVCKNFLCKKIFTRRAKLIEQNKNYFCSQSCAATVNNVLFPKVKRKNKICGFCKKVFHKRNSLYCSRICKVKAQVVPSAAIIEEIQLFFTQNGRIPLKQEFHHDHAAQIRFGSWNKAILAAGFTPNPVKFTKKYKAIDQHICDSFSEMIIDNWLHKHNIDHKRNIPYGQTKMTADFKIKNTLVEFIGLQGVKAYDKHLKNKTLFWKKKKLPVVTIYPNDLFPINKLDHILNSLL